MLLYCPAAIIKNVTTFHIRNVHHLVQPLQVSSYFYYVTAQVSNLLSR